MSDHARIRRAAAMPELPGDRSVAVAIRDLAALVADCDEARAETARLREALEVIADGDPPDGKVRKFARAALAASPAAEETPRP